MLVSCKWFLRVSFPKQVRSWTCMQRRDVLVHRLVLLLVDKLLIVECFFLGFSHSWLRWVVDYRGGSEAVIEVSVYLLHVLHQLLKWLLVWIWICRLRLVFLKVFLGDASASVSELDGYFNLLYLFFKRLHFIVINLCPEIDSVRVVKCIFVLGLHSFSLGTAFGLDWSIVTQECVALLILPELLLVRGLAAYFLWT